jgi:hypothetical protein
VHKDSTQTNKRSKLGIKFKGAKKPSVLWSGAPDCPVCHRTVSGAPGPYKDELATLGFLQAHSAIIHRTVRCTGGVTAIQHNGRLQRLTATLRCATESEAHQTMNSGCPVPLENKASNGQKLQNPNGWVTWLAHRTVSGGAPDCPVRPSTAACPNGHLVVEGY